MGEKHDKDLPKLANKKQKIPRQFINANWLAENPKMDVPSRINDDTIPVQSGDPESCGDGDTTLYDGGDEEDLEEQGHLPEGSNGQLVSLSWQQTMNSPQ